jgi:hypothetical protein
MNKKVVTKNQTIKIRVDELFREHILQLCQKNNKGMSDIIRKLVDEAYSKEI